jgi:eukaryotic-like serine/threonine-protein kinase
MVAENHNFEAGIYGLPVGPGPASSGREPLEVLASEFLSALRGANRPNVEDYARQHPDLADEIRELFPVLASLEDWKLYRERTSFEHRSLDTLPNELFGSFRIVREVGRGGMGVVFEAHEQRTARRVAIKVIPFFQSNRLRESFEREARTAARLRHPHIVPVFAFGEHDGLCYYIMRLIEGVGLDWLIRQLGEAGLVMPRQISAQFATPREGHGSSSDDPAAENKPQSVKSSIASTSEFPTMHQSPVFAEGLRRDSWLEIARIGAQVAHALHYAHSCGTLHRDIKPANLLLDANGRIWITDFGLAHSTEGLGSHKSSRTAGTLRYLAPEQFEGRVDVRSDIYSLGVTLFELLTHTPAFETRDRQSLITAIRQSALPRPRSLNASIPRDLEAIILKAAAKEPASRYVSAVELWADLMRFLKGQRVGARRRWLG